MLLFSVYKLHVAPICPSVDPAVCHTAARCDISLNAISPLGVLCGEAIVADVNWFCCTFWCINLQKQQTSFLAHHMLPIISLLISRVDVIELIATWPVT